jgi:hypothetical protein
MDEFTEVMFFIAEGACTFCNIFKKTPPNLPLLRGGVRRGDDLESSRNLKVACICAQANPESFRGCGYMKN